MKFKLFLFLICSAFLFVGCKSTENTDNGEREITYLKSDLLVDKEKVYRLRSALTDSLSDRSHICAFESTNQTNVEQLLCYKPVNSDGIDNLFSVVSIVHHLSKSAEDSLSIKVFRATDDPKKYGFNVVSMYSIAVDGLESYKRLLDSTAREFNARIILNKRDN